MEPIKRKDRSAFRGGPRLSVASVEDDSKFDDIDDFLFMPSDKVTDDYNEDGDLSFLNDDGAEKKQSMEEIKIKALNLAIGIAKLMSDVTLDSILKIADKVAAYMIKK